MFFKFKSKSSINRSVPNKSNNISQNSVYQKLSKVQKAENKVLIGRQVEFDGESKRSNTGYEPGNDEL